MLDELLALAKKGHDATIRNLNLETKKRIFNKIYTMTEELELDKIDDFEKRVKMRHDLIQKFPDTVFWDYAECANIISGKRKTSVPDFERFLVCKISTRGDVVIFNEIKKLLIYTATDSSRYGTSKLNYSERTHHRLIASTFVPRPDRLSHIDYKYLQVNHIDSIRGNCAANNLEWVTEQENQRHRYGVDRYSDEKFFLFTVAIDNGFLGREFVLSEHDLHLFDTTFNEIRRVDEEGTYKGCTVSLIHKEEIGERFIGFPEDISALFRTDPRYFNIKIRPIVYTITEGDYKGYQFSLFGSTEISKYFHRGNVQRLLQDKKSSSQRGYVVRFATHKEAIPLHGKLADDVLNCLREMDSLDPRVKPIIVTILRDGPYKGFQFSLFGDNEISKYFYGPGIYECIRKGTATYKNCHVRFATREEALPLRGKLTDEIADYINNNGKYFLLEVTVDNGFLGRRFVIDIRDVPNGLNQSIIREIAGTKKLHHGFSVKPIDYSLIGQYELGMPEDIKTLFTKNVCYFDPYSKPVAGEILEGNFQGLTFSLFGKTEIAKYFNQPSVSVVATKANGEGATHYGCTFRFCTHREAIPLHGKLTDEIGEYLKEQCRLKNEKKYFLFEVIVDNGFLGRQFVLDEDNLPDGFLIDALTVQTTGPNRRERYKGFEVTVHRQEEVAEYEFGFPEDIAELYYEEPRYFHYKISSFLGTVLIGPHKGLQFSFLGAQESDEYFNSDKVSLVARGKLESHNGCVFRYCSHREARALRHRMTKDIADSLRQYNFHWDDDDLYRQINLLNKDLQFPITLLP